MQTDVTPQTTTAVIPRHPTVTLQADVDGGSHKAGAYRLGMSESTSLQRESQLMGLVGAWTAAEAVWLCGGVGAGLATDPKCSPIGG